MIEYVPDKSNLFDPEIVLKLVNENETYYGLTTIDQIMVNYLDYCEE